MKRSARHSTQTNCRSHWRREERRRMQSDHLVSCVCIGESRLRSLRSFGGQAPILSFIGPRWGVAQPSLSAPLRATAGGSAVCYTMFDGVIMTIASADFIGESPSGKAAAFGAAIRRFESFLPSQAEFELSTSPQGAVRSRRCLAPHQCAALGAVANLGTRPRCL